MATDRSPPEIHASPQSWWILLFPDQCIPQGPLPQQQVVSLSRSLQAARAEQDAIDGQREAECLLQHQNCVSIDKLLLQDHRTTRRQSRESHTGAAAGTVRPWREEVAAITVPDSYTGMHLPAQLGPEDPQALLEWFQSGATKHVCRLCRLWLMTGVVQILVSHYT